MKKVFMIKNENVNCLAFDENDSHKRFFIFPISNINDHLMFKEVLILEYVVVEPYYSFGFRENIDQKALKALVE